MTCHACGKEHPDERLVTLPDGRRVSSYSREWLVECEAAWVVKRLPNKATTKKMSKADYLRAIADRRGPQAYLELRQAMERQYRLRYPSKSPK